MKIIDVTQGTQEWLEARVGIPTSSNFDKIVMMNGSPSKQREKYLYRLAGEAIIGKPEETYKNAIMERGILMETEARQAYELLTGTDVVQVGLCLSDDGKYGASPDGLVGKEGMIEIKCPTLAVHVSYLLKGVLPSEYYQQVQGQLFVTERKWLDFMSYYPGIKPFIIRVLPDRAFHEKLKVELSIACATLKTVIHKLRG